MEFFSLSILPFTALTGITGRIVVDEHKTYNLFLKKMLGDVWDQLCISVGVISCVYFGVCLRTGWMEIGWLQGRAGGSWLLKCRSVAAGCVWCG